MLVRSYEVEEVKFPVALRGYAEDEVDAFLDRVVETIKEYERSDAERRSEIKRLQAALDECREARIQEGGAADAAQALSEETETRLQDMVKEAARASERMVKRAAFASERMVEEALEACEHILHQIRSPQSDPDPAQSDPPTPAPAPIPPPAEG